MPQLTEVAALRSLTADGRLLFGTRAVRLFAYGSLAVVLALYLAELGLGNVQIGLLLTLTLAGDTVISLGMASVADRLGRRRMLLAGAALMLFAGAVFASTNNIALLTLAAILGTISPSGNEVGPFLSIEEATLPQTTTDDRRTSVFAIYSLAGSISTALGALYGGWLVVTLQHSGLKPLDSYRGVVIGYGLLAVVLALLYSRLSPTAEARAARTSASERGLAAPGGRSVLGLRRSRNVVLRLSSLFMLDAFAGGLVVQSLMAYWFYLRFGADPGLLGGIFFGANILAGLSALAAARVAARFGLVNTMVWTHVPSNVLLILVPLMPTLPLAAAVLLARFSISQMDVPTRQSYTMAVVDPDERSAAAGVTTVARTAASSLAPSITGILFGLSLFSLSFFLAGALKLAYDFLLYRSFRALKPPEEETVPAAPSPAKS